LTFAALNSDRIRRAVRRLLPFGVLAAGVLAGAGTGGAAFAAEGATAAGSQCTVDAKLVPSCGVL
jgi:hypothetical protein